MTTVSILRDPRPDNGAAYYADGGGLQAVGSTPGASLDALTAQLGDSRRGTLVVVQQFRPDEFFSAEQQQRLEQLMLRWRDARDQGGCLPAEEQAELDELIDAELVAAGRRSAVLADSRERTSLLDRRYMSKGRMTNESFVIWTFVIRH